MNDKADSILRKYEEFFYHACSWVYTHLFWIYDYEWKHIIFFIFEKNI